MKNSKHLKPAKAFTLVELVITIAIGAVIFVPMALFITEIVTNAFLPEHYQVAASLLEGEVERVTNIRFVNVADESLTSYTGNFSQYSYQVDVEYVQAGSLNTSVSPTVTDYKRVEIVISRPAFPNVSAVTIMTDN